MATGSHTNKKNGVKLFYSSKSIKLSSMKKIRDYAWPPNFDSYIELILKRYGNAVLYPGRWLDSLQILMTLYPQSGEWELHFMLHRCFMEDRDTVDLR